MVEKPGEGKKFAFSKEDLDKLSPAELEKLGKDVATTAETKAAVEQYYQEKFGTPNYTPEIHTQAKFDLMSAVNNILRPKSKDGK
jgi:hypothetical protein